MSKFEPGDWVVVKSPSVWGYHGLIGKTAKIFRITGDGRYIIKDAAGGERSYRTQDLEGGHRDLSNLQEGDVIQDCNGDEYTVVGVHKLAVHLTEADGSWTDRTIEFLKDNDYRIKSEEDGKDLVEVTLEEVAKKLDVPVEKLRIKD